MEIIKEIVAVVVIFFIIILGFCSSFLRLINKVEEIKKEEDYRG